MDRLTQEERSALMKRVRRSDTAPELKLRRALHRQGLRYVVADKRLPGTPDLVFPRYRAAVFVHGCFWHGHECRQGRTPSSNEDFWRAKIVANRNRDERKCDSLAELGWRVFVVWECAFRKLNGAALEQFARELAARVRLSALIL